MHSIRSLFAPMNSLNAPWWQHSCVYQIYPRSFCDSNGDGIGDLAGIQSRLDHLVELGVDVVWLSPVYASPNQDNGYDISNYRDIAPEFGTLADFDALLSAMHARGLRLIMDLVVNHTSDQHEWFRQARSSRDNPYHDYYIWREPVDGHEPTNWEAVFSGSAWSWNEATGEYYLHMFSPHQPDLNWENPRLRDEVYELMRFWLDKGIDGFRMDVINMISKPFNADGSLPAAPVVRDGFLQPGMGMAINGPRLQEYLLEMRREVLDHYDCLTVGEAPGATPEHGIALTSPKDGALSMLFQFEHMEVDTQPGQPKWALKRMDLPDLKRSLGRWQRELAGRGWNSLYLCNHDQPRVVSRFGDDERWLVRSAKLLGSVLHGQQGTPYVYQGEELGMTNYPFADISECRDIETLNMWQDAVEQRGEDPQQVLRSIRAKGRDNARTPMQWDGSQQAGFTRGTPWLAVNPNHTEINADRQHGEPDSVFHFYRRLISLRKKLDVLVHGDYLDLEPDHERLYAYVRRHAGHALLVLANVSGQDLPFTPPAELVRARLVVTNAMSPVLLPSRLVLEPWESCWYLLSDDEA